MLLALMKQYPQMPAQLNCCQIQFQTEKNRPILVLRACLLKDAKLLHFRWDLDPEATGLLLAVHRMSQALMIWCPQALHRKQINHHQQPLTCRILKVNMLQALTPMYLISPLQHQTSPELLLNRGKRAACRLWSEVRWTHRDPYMMWHRGNPLKLKIQNSWPFKNPRWAWLDLQ